MCNHGHNLQLVEGGQYLVEEENKILRELLELSVFVSF
jgi:hypothetical protein